MNTFFRSYLFSRRGQISKPDLVHFKCFNRAYCQLEYCPGNTDASGRGWGPKRHINVFLSTTHSVSANSFGKVFDMEIVI